MHDRWEEILGYMNLDQVYKQLCVSTLCLLARDGSSYFSTSLYGFKIFKIYGTHTLRYTILDMIVGILESRMLACIDIDVHGHGDLIVFWRMLQQSGAAFE